MSLTLTLKDNGGNPVSGEGTSITLNNTTETNFTKFDLYGDTEQQTYTGKNLAKPYQTSGSITYNDVTFTMQSDGSILIDGTSSGNIWLEFVGAFSSSPSVKTTPVVALDSSKTYTLSSTIASGNYTQGTGSTAAIYYQYDYPSAESALWNINGGRTSKTGLNGLYRAWLRIFAGNSFDKCVLQVQFEEGSQKTSFEPYVGGTASPNPDYPQEVKTVTGEQTITVSNGQGGSQVYPVNLGKNLFNSSFELGGIDINTGLDVGLQDRVRTIGYVAVMPNTTYTISGVSGSRFAIFYNSSKTYLGYVLVDSQATQGTFTTPTGTSYIRWYIIQTQTDIDEQLERGSTATTYAPYITAFGKNLFDIDQYTNAVTRGSSLVSLTKLSDTTLRTTNLYASTNNYCAIPLPDASRLLGNTITMSCNVTLTNVTATKAAIFWKTTSNSIGTQIGDTLSITTSGAKTLTFSVPDAFPSGTDGIFCTIYGSDSAQPADSYVDWENIQIEKGSTVTAYEPNMSGQLELCEIGDYQDYLYKSEGNWYVHRETGKVTFTGAETETWSSATAATGYVRFSTASGETHADNNGYCNELINRGSQSHGAYEYVWVQPNANAFYIQVLNTRANNLASFRTWLGTNPATVYYNIATPTDTQITYEPLVAQLEALYNTAHSYNGATIVTISSQYLPAIMDVTIGASTNEVTYTETELSNPLTITDIEGKSQNTTLNGNIYVDYVYNKKSFSVSIFNLKSADYATIRGFYDRQFTLNEFPLLSIPELNISEMPVFFEIGSREINSQCIVTDKLTLKFRETAQQ